MVCGNVIVQLKEPKGKDRMPTLTITFFVLSVDKTGHIVWPTEFEPPAKAALRMQV